MHVLGDSLNTLNHDLEPILQLLEYHTIQSLNYSRLASFQLPLESSVTVYKYVKMYSVPMTFGVMSSTEFFFNTFSTIRECSTFPRLPLQLLQILSLYAAKLVLGNEEVKSSKPSSASGITKGVDESASVVQRHTSL